MLELIGYIAGLFYIPFKWRGKYTPRLDACISSNKISVEDDKIIIAEIFALIFVMLSYVAPPRTGVQLCLVHQSRCYDPNYSG